MSLTTEFNLEEVVNDTYQALFAKPKVSRELATELLKTLYGLEVTEVEEMNSFGDQNLHVKVSKQHRNPYIDQVNDFGYTLKVINTSKSALDGHFDSMHTVVQHLDKKGLRVPVPVKNLEGKTWSLEKVPLMNTDDKPADKACGVYLYTYIPGVTAAAIENTPENFFQWGVLLAKFHKALEDLECPYLKTKLVPSNYKFFPFIEYLMDCIDEDAKKLVFPVLKRFSSEVTEKISNLPEGFIHGDYHDHNILVQLTDPDANTYVADGILDFEDIHYEAYAWDLGVMLAHVSTFSKTLDPLEATGFAVAGYRSVRSLTEEEISILKIFMECRLCQTLVYLNHCAKLDPDNDYISSVTLTEPRCAVLDILAKTKKEDLLEKWNDIYVSYCPNKTLDL